MAGRPSLRRRLAVLLAPLALPWNAAVVDGGLITLVFPWGLVTPRPPSVTTLSDYLFVYTSGLPGYLRAWPASVGLYALAVCFAVTGAATGLDDRRITAGLLALAGAAHVTLALGFAAQPGRYAVPTGTLVLGAVAWWYYRRADAGAADTRPV